MLFEATECVVICHTQETNTEGNQRKEDSNQLEKMLGTGLVHSGCHTRAPHGGLNNRQSLSQSGVWESEIKVSAQLVSSEASLLAV